MKVGDKFWWFRIGFNRSGSTWRSQRPVQLEVTSIVLENRHDWIDGEWKDIPDNYCKLSTRRGGIVLEGWEGEFNDDTFDYYRLYNTEEEAREAWNKTVRNELDLARSEYEERVRKIKKKLI